MWVAVCKENEICSVSRLTCKLEEKKTLDVLLYMQDNVLWELQPLASYLKNKRLIEVQRLFTKPDYRQKGTSFMLFWCISKASYLAGVDGICFTSNHNFQKFNQNFQRWEFDYGDGVKTNLFFLSSQYLPELTNHFKRHVYNM